jgi:hypothetical protein
MTSARNLKEDLILPLEQDFLIVRFACGDHGPIEAQ